MKTSFSSRWGLILAALGMAIGTGNVWRFPRILAQNGGGTFLIPWALFLFTWSIPLLMVEFALGRSSQRGPVGAFARTFGAGATWRGGFVAFCTLAILFYYSVVSGWTVRYLGLALNGFSGIEPANAEATFLGFTEGYGPAFTHLLSIGVACVVVMAGVTRGIERACRVLVPTLFVVLMLCAVRGLTLEGSGAGLDFLLNVDAQLLTQPKVWLEALSQSAWSTGAGWGLMVCYAIYASRNSRATRECVTTGVGNNLASLLAALAIIPAVFALVPLAQPGAVPAEVVGSGGPASTGLTFVWMPVLFRHMPWGGGTLGTLFFLGLAFAALSSLIAMVELAVRTLLDLGFTRRRAAAATFVVAFLLGLPSAVDIGFIPGHRGLSFFSNQDWVWGVGLIVSGGLAAFSVLRHGAGRFYDEYIAAPEQRSPGGGLLFRVAVSVLLPLQAVGLLGWWFWQAWSWTETDAAGNVQANADRLADWLDPTALYSVGTCLAQWAVVIVVLLFVNRRLAAGLAVEQVGGPDPGAPGR